MGKATQKLRLENEMDIIPEHLNQAVNNLPKLTGGK